MLLTIPSSVPFRGGNIPASSKHLSNWSIELLKIETGFTTLGIPDIYYYSDRPRQFAGWMELKHVPTFQVPKIIIPWQPGQIIRGKDFVAADVPYWLIVSADDTSDFAFIPGCGNNLKLSYYTNEINFFHLNQVTSEQLYYLIYYYKY